MDNEKLVATLAIVTPKIIEYLIKKHNMEYEIATSTLYDSKLYSALESAETGLWRLSPLTLYTLLEEELSTGKITFPEEQA